MTTFFRWRPNFFSASIAGITLSAMLLPAVGAQETQESLTIRNEAAVPAEAGVETILRGALHEAFAEPIELDAKPTVVIRREPPEPIEELPPEVRPTDDNSEWIGGYWSWDEERDDFMWTSGIWRVAPPGQRWVPGHWVQVDGGFQWVSGFWAGADVEEVTYLPYPPESLEQGPNQPAPSNDYYWVSGQWLYRGGRYAWRGGYWNAYRAGWAWNPSYYVWTPRGAIFVNGYWDYPFANRGTLFAPVYFSQPIYRRTGYSYSPNVAVNVTRLALNLFVNPGYNHYYYGDYYSSSYAQRGYSPWFQYAGGRSGYYDPMLTYYRTSYRMQGLDYDQRMQGWYNYYSRNPNHRPPRTFADQVRVASQFQGNQNLQYALLGSSVGDLMTSGSGRNQFTRLPEETRRSLGKTANEFRNVATQRQRLESAIASNTNANVDTPADRKVGKGARANAHTDARLTLPRVQATANAAPAVAPETPERPTQEHRSGDPSARDAGKARPDGKAGNAKKDNQKGSKDDQKAPPDADKAKDKGRRGDSRNPDTDATRPGRDRSKSARPDTTAVIPEAPASTEQPGAEDQKGSTDKAKKDIDAKGTNPANRDQEGRDPGNAPGKSNRNGKSNRDGAADGNRNQPRKRSAEPLPMAELPKTDLPKTDLPKTDLPKSDRPKSELPKIDLPKAEAPSKAKQGGSSNANRSLDVNSLPRSGRVDSTDLALPPATDRAPNSPRGTRDPNASRAGRPEVGSAPRDVTPDRESRAGVSDAPKTTRNRVDPDTALQPRRDGAAPPTAGEGRRGRNSDSVVPRADLGKVNPSPRNIPATEVPRERPIPQASVRSLPSTQDRSSAAPMNRAAPSVNREPAPAARSIPSAVPTARSAKPPAPAPTAKRANNPPKAAKADDAKGKDKVKDKD